MRDSGNIMQYQVEFSKPHQIKPIPEGTVKVYFYIILMPGGEGEEDSYEVEFNFENESLKHKLNNTMRKNMFEVSYLLTPRIVYCSNGSTVFWKTN